MATNKKRSQVRPVARTGQRCAVLATKWERPRCGDLSAAAKCGLKTSLDVAIMMTLVPPVKRQLIPPPPHYSREDGRLCTEQKV